MELHQQLITHFLIVFHIFYFALPVLGQNNECGALITYRQHAFLLSEAPLCLRNGCGNNQTATTISSPCPADAPCFKLWDILRAQFQRDWCASCENDIACRIHGWPVLNMTTACNISPQEWLFYTNGGCCVAANEPFLVADWVKRLCNGSEWRTPFEYYGGMAKEDWEEWIEPWNWTVQPHNSSTITVPLGSCSSSGMLLTWGIENIVDFATFLAGAIYVFSEGPRSKGSLLPSNNHWVRTVAAGVADGVAKIIGNLGSALLVRDTPGYQDVTIGGLFLLFSTRPSVVGLFCSLGFFSPKFERGRRLKRPEYRYYIADVVASFVIAELMHQVTASIYYGITADMGRKKDFFHIGHLTPYWRGSEAQRMYAGGLIYTILFPFTFVGLLVLAWLQVKKVHLEHFESWHRPFRRYLKWVERTFDERLRYEEAESQKRVNESAAQTAQQVAQLGLAARIFTTGPLATLVLLPPMIGHAAELQQHEQRLLENEAEREIASQWRIETLKRWPRPEDTLEHFRIRWTIFVVSLWVVVYIAQWIFWSGFVESSGDRWCPPDTRDFKPKIRSILSAFAAFGTLLSFYLNLSGLASEAAAP